MHFLWGEGTVEDFEGGRVDSETGTLQKAASSLNEGTGLEFQGKKGNGIFTIIGLNIIALGTAETKAVVIPGVTVNQDGAEAHFLSDNEGTADKLTADTLFLKSGEDADRAEANNINHRPIRPFDDGASVGNMADDPAFMFRNEAEFFDEILTFT